MADSLLEKIRHKEKMGTDLTKRSGEKYTTGWVGLTSLPILSRPLPEERVTKLPKKEKPKGIFR